MPSGLNRAMQLDLPQVHTDPCCLLSLIKCKLQFSSRNCLTPQVLFLSYYTPRSTLCYSMPAAKCTCNMYVAGPQPAAGQLLRGFSFCCMHILGQDPRVAHAAYSHRGLERSVLLNRSIDCWPRQPNTPLLSPVQMSWRHTGVRRLRPHIF